MNYAFVLFTFVRHNLVVRLLANQNWSWKGALSNSNVKHVGVVWTQYRVFMR